MTQPVPVLKLNLKVIALVQAAIVGGLSCLIAMFWQVQLGASFATGAGIMFVNLLLLMWIWGRVLAKKSFALTSLIIVVKYTVLLGAIFFLTRETWFHVLSAGLGMAAFILSTLIQLAFAKWE